MRFDWIGVPRKLLPIVEKYKSPLLYPRKFLAEEAASRYGFRIHEIVISYRFLSSPAKYHYVQGISPTWKKIQEEIKEGIIDFEMKFRTSLMRKISRSLKRLI